MARETKRRWRTLEGMVLVGGVLSAVAAYTYLTEKQRGYPADARVVCERCGDALPVTDVLDPGVTCSCIPTDQTDSEFY